MATRKTIVGRIRPLPADDPRNPDHPSHEEQWLALARALGSAMADRDFERDRAAARHLPKETTPKVVRSTEDGESRNCK
jgi:hypothetical protein